MRGVESAGAFRPEGRMPPSPATGHVRGWAGAVLLTLAVLATPAGVGAQQPRLRGYFLHVAIAADEGPFTPRGVTDFQRLRAMATWAPGPLRLDAAYEHSLTLSGVPGGQALTGGLGQVGAAGDWLPLQGVLHESERVVWRHRVDRAVATLVLGALELSAGRQPVSWATTLFLTPADPFAPFDPSEPFRTYRPGVDALRVRAFPGAFTEVDLVVRPAETPVGRTLSALARGRTVVAGLEVAGWGGVVHDDAAGGLALTLTVAGAALRAEGVVRRAADSTVLRAALGADRHFVVAGRSLYLVVEYQHDGFGAGSVDAIVPVVLSPAARRGELQVVGRDVAALQASYRVHALAGVDLLGLVNLRDWSALLAPALSYGASAELTLRGGAFVGLGTGAIGPGTPGSEFGAVPLLAYVSAELFF